MRQGPRIYSILKVSMEGSCVGLKGNMKIKGQNELQVSGGGSAADLYLIFMR